MTVSEAREAFFHGDFERALSLCDAVVPPDDEARLELALLRARTLIRLDQVDRAVEILHAAAPAAAGPDQRVTLKMLLGAAYVRLGQVHRGITVLRGTLDASPELHPTIRAELVLNLGIAWFRLGDYDEANRLLSEISPNADIVYARALEYLGWIAQARADFPAAARAFQESLVALRGGAHSDRYVEASSLYGLAMLVPELLLVGDWAMLEPWLRRFDWPVSGVVSFRFWTLIASALMYEVVGDVAAAREAARLAEGLAADDGHRVVALCRLAATFRAIGEMQGHAEFLARARSAYDTLNVLDLSSDLRLLPLYLAEELVAGGDADGAYALLVRYREVIVPAAHVPTLEYERWCAMANSVEAMIREARGDRDGAVSLFASAFRTFSSHGYRRRAASLALRLARLTGKKRYERYTEDALREVHPGFWMARELSALRGGNAPALTRTESEILALVVRGLSYKQIATKRSVSWKTVGNHVQALFRKFGVRSRAELAAEALRLRIVAVETRRNAS
jgi:DNA-binding CsgD family transcriptional regulator